MLRGRAHLTYKMEQCSCLLALIFICGVSRVNGDAPDGVKNRLKACEHAFHLTTANATVSFTMNLPADATTCIWNIFGDKGCPVELSCKVDIRQESDDCESGEFVKVTDGSLGRKHFCGKSEFSGLRASKGLRDLYVVMETSASPPESKLEGLSCTAKCAAKGSGKKMEKNLNRKIEPRCVCGIKNKDDRIVDGEDAKKFEFPWQAAVVFADTRSPMCGASIINDRFILCAAHCFAFEDLPASEFNVLLHAHVLDMTEGDEAQDVPLGQDGSIRTKGHDLAEVTDEDENTQRFKVLDIITHPLFTSDFDYDYALLRIDKNIDLGEADAPTPICLPNVTAWDKVKLNGRNLTVVGWGKGAENAGGTTRLLQKLDVPYIDFDTCAKWIGPVLTQRMICAGYEHGIKDACTGDSGGPLIMKSTEKGFEDMWFQWGIVSWGEGCARAQKPGVYSRVTEMMQWIHFHTGQQDPKWCQESKNG